MTYNKLLEKFSTHSGKLMAAVKDLPEMQGEGNKRHLLTSIHKLNIDINSKYVALVNIKDDLKKVVVFLRRIPNKKFYEENEISELDYVKYHLEVFFHKVATGSDLLKLLVNVVFELDIPNRSCNMKSLQKKLPEKHHQSFLKLIDAYDETFKSIKFFRHKSSHEGKFYDDEFDRLYMFDDLYRNSKKFDLETESLIVLMPEFLLEFKIKELRKDKIKWITDAIDAYEKYIDKIIENSLYIYFTEYKAWVEEKPD